MYVAISKFMNIMWIFSSVLIFVDGNYGMKWDANYIKDEKSVLQTYLFVV
jgi:hypothetical protein